MSPWGIALVAALSFALSFAAGRALFWLFPCTCFRCPGLGRVMRAFYGRYEAGLLLLDDKERLRHHNAAAQNMLGTGLKSGGHIMASLPEWAQAHYASAAVLILDEPQGDAQALSLRALPLQLFSQRIGTLLVLQDTSRERPSDTLLLQRHMALEEEVRRRADEEIQFIGRDTLGTLSSIVAHDFNNLLAAIIGFSHAARADLPASASAWPHIEAIYQTALEVRTLIAQLLAFSATPVPAHEPVDIGQLLTELHPLLDAVRVPEVAVVVQRDTEDARVMGNRTHLMQLLFNLSINALEAMPAGGELRLDLGRAPRGAGGEGLFVRVQDTGEGMDADTNRFAFEPFFSTRRDNLGLGLTISERIAQDHGARLILDSTPGAGTTATLRIPLLRTGASPGENSGAFPGASPGIESLKAPSV